MQLKNEINSLDPLYNTVAEYYSDRGRRCLIFDAVLPGESVDSGFYIRFLLDRKHVLEYRMERERGFFLSVVSLAIGPHYFTPGDFWDYENSQRFNLDASTEAIEQNLKLLDEFLYG